MLPVVAMCGHLWGLDMTATTAMPDAVLTGLARSLQECVHSHMMKLSAKMRETGGMSRRPLSDLERAAAML